MRTCLCALALALLVLALSSCARPTASPRADELTPAAEQFVDLLVAGDFATAAADFDHTMTTVMPPAKLQEAWQSIVTQYGPFKEQVAAQTVVDKGFDIAVVTCQFEEATIDIRVVYNDDAKIGGLWFAPR